VVKTLAMVYSEKGEFQKAVKTAEDALRLARKDEQSVLAEKIQKEISLYKMGKPFTAGIVRKRRI